MTQHDPVVVVGAARTPMGAFQGELKDLSAPELGASAIRAALQRAGIGGDVRKSSWAACCRRAGPGAGAAGVARRRACPARCRLHHRQQGVRLGHEGGDARP